MKSGWTGERYRHGMARKGIKSKTIKYNSKGIEEIPKNILDIIAKYEKKDYWGTENLIKNAIESWKFVGKPKPHTPDSIRQYFSEELHNERLKWVSGMIRRIKNKDKSYLNNVLRHDQKFTKEIFTAVTGIETQGKSTKDLKNIINEYVNKK